MLERVARHGDSCYCARTAVSRSCGHALGSTDQDPAGCAALDAHDVAPTLSPIGEKPADGEPPRRTPRWLKLSAAGVTALAALIVALTGVGQLFKDSGESTGGGAKPPAIEEWARKASKACLSSADERADIGQPDTHNVVENVRRARLWADDFRQTGDVVQRIGTPADYAAEVEEFTALFDALGDDFDLYATDQAQGQTTHEDDRRAQRETARLFGRWNILAERLGARGCA